MNTVTGICGTHIFDNFVKQIMLRRLESGLLLQSVQFRPGVRDVMLASSWWEHRSRINVQFLHPVQSVLLWFPSSVPWVLSKRRDDSLQPMVKTKCSEHAWWAKTKLKFFNQQSWIVKAQCYIKEEFWISVCESNTCKRGQAIQMRRHVWQNTKPRRGGEPR